MIGTISHDMEIGTCPEFNKPSSELYPLPSNPASHRGEAMEFSARFFLIPSRLSPISNFKSAIRLS